MKFYKKIPVQQISLDNLIGDFEPRDNSFIHKVDESLTEQAYIDRFTGDKQKVVKGLLDGMNFHQISQDSNISQSKVYRIKRELQHDFAFLKDDHARKKFVGKHAKDIRLLYKHLQQTVAGLSLSEFTQLYLYDYDDEAIMKEWRTALFQDTLYHIWENNPFSCTLAPREHLKTYSVLAYLAKKIFVRPYPLEINYYHHNEEIAYEKFRKLQRTIENNPIMIDFLRIDRAKYWREDAMELYDGTIIRPLSYGSGVVGKHPHINVIDDPIDRKVIYSDVVNQKSIEKFYTDIYPQITKPEKDKKVIIIGTMQRKDDLYNKLPDNFKISVFKAINDDGSLLCPEMYTHETLMKVKADISKHHGEKFWLKEYMNVPFEAMGLIIKDEWIKTYHNIEPEMLNKMKIYQGWDLSVGRDIEKGDWTACATIGIYTDREGDQHIYILNIYRDRIDFGTRVRMVTNKFNDYKALLVGIEDVAFQYDTIQEVKNKTTIPVIGIKAIKNKVESFQAELAPYFENGKIYLREDMKDLRNELLSLPVGDHDDMADALKIAIKTSLQVPVQPGIRVLGG